MVAWASWCGCRLDLPVWQALMDSTRDQSFTVLAIALDEPEAARPWIEAASPTYPCLIDREHRVAELYHLVNVPQAVWIDEEGRIVRPPENAGSTDGFDLYEGIDDHVLSNHDSSAANRVLDVGEGRNSR